MLQYTPKGSPDEDESLHPFTQEETQRMHQMLRRKLGPEHVSTRQGMGGMRLSYIEGWRIISIANEVFGFNGWRSSIQNLTIDYVDAGEDGRFSIGASCVMRITLRDGTYREDVGFGMIENTKSKGQALEKVRKEAVTDGLKRAMRQFGNVLGNCVYDKDFLRNMGQVQKQPRGAIQGDSLYRYTDLENQSTPPSASATSTASNPSNETTSNTGNSSKRQACEPGTLPRSNQTMPAADLSTGNRRPDLHHNASTDFDLDYMYDDVLDMMVDLETDRPIIPDSPSSCYVNDMPATEMRRKMPPQAAQTPSNVISTPMSIGSSVKNRSAPESAARPSGSLARGEWVPPSSRNLSFEAPPHPPQPDRLPNTASVQQQQQQQQNGSMNAVSGRPKSFADVSSFTPASHGKSGPNLTK
ncbi:DNA repair protein rad52 [Coemansia sp. RSA 2049]|nr:DNA repair protein rad52 [Coemansia sp. RSA 2049]